MKIYSHSAWHIMSTQKCQLLYFYFATCEHYNLNSSLEMET